MNCMEYTTVCPTKLVITGLNLTAFGGQRSENEHRFQGQGWKMGVEEILYFDRK